MEKPSLPSTSSSNVHALPYDELFIETTVWLSTTTVLSGSIAASLPALHFFLSRLTSGSVNVKNRLNVVNLLFGTISSFGGKSEDRECGRGRERETNFSVFDPSWFKGCRDQTGPKEEREPCFSASSHRAVSYVMKAAKVRKAHASFCWFMFREIGWRMEGSFPSSSFRVSE